MSYCQPISLLGAGCQPWNFEVIAVSEQRFAYCATLSIYVYQKLEDQYGLHSVISVHKKTITSLCWHPTNENLICATSCDRSAIIWDISRGVIHSQVDGLADIPITSDFMGEHVVALCLKRSSVLLWRYNDSSVDTPKDYRTTFSSDVTIIKSCPRVPDKILVGHSNGTISLLFKGRKAVCCVGLLPEGSNELNDDGGSATYSNCVMTIKWDPHSADYALVLRYQLDLNLINANELTVIKTYRLSSQSSHIQTVSWLPDCPGMFVTGDQSSGILRIWSVSSSEAIEVIKVKTDGFHALAVVPEKADQLNLPTRNGGSSRANSSIATALIFCAFFDGGIGLYSLQQRKWLFSRNKGHIETVFDCKFCPANGERLATVSFDGSVKIWNTSNQQLECEASSAGNEGILYTLSWAPADLNCIAVSTAKYGVFIWDINRNKITQRFTEHGKQKPVYSVSWNQLNTKKILSAGADFHAIVRDVDGSNVMRFAHPACVYGCEWSPTNMSLFATGCEDGQIRIFYLPSVSSPDTSYLQPLKIFPGHSAKSFHVRWSTLRDGCLASGSDDMTIRVWSYGDDTCVQVLHGHTAQVRGLCWSPEIVYLLYSGSWDHTIRMWDVRSGVAISCIQEHGGDVYGLSIHSDSPFVLASCSRDSTVRLWSTYHVAAPLLHIYTLDPNSHQQIFSKPEAAFELDKPPLLCGVASKRLSQQMSGSSSNDCSWHLQSAKLFQCCTGVTNLFDLIGVILGRPEHTLSSTYGDQSQTDSIVHTKHLIKYTQSQALSMDMEAHMSTTSGGKIGAPKKRDRVLQAAEQFIKIGNIKKYCELMVEIDEWEKALSLAPAVSHDFWRELLSRYTGLLASRRPDQCLPFYTALGDSMSLVSYYSSSASGPDHQRDAILAAVLHRSKLLPDYTNTSSLHSTCRCNSEHPLKTSPADDGGLLLVSTVDDLAMKYLKLGQPVRAACVYLSVDRFECIRCLHALSHKRLCRAAAKECTAALLRGNCVELALSVGTLLSAPQYLLALAAEILAYRCEQHNDWMASVSLLSCHSTGFDLMKYKLAIRSIQYGAAVSEKIKSMLGIALEDQTSLQAQDDSLHAAERVKWLLLSSKQVKGVQLAVSILHEKLRSSLDSEVVEILECVQSVSSDLLDKQPVLLYDLLTISCYIGALRSIVYGYHTLVPFLLRTTCNRLKADASNPFPLSTPQMQQELEEYLQCRDNGNKSALVEKAERLNSPMMPSQGKNLLVGEICVAGCSFPGHSIRRSIVTGDVIKGPAFLLEDSKSYLSASEAAMWARVNLFSPISCLQNVAISTKIYPYS